MALDQICNEGAREGERVEGRATGWGWGWGGIREGGIGIWRGRERAVLLASVSAARESV